MPHVCHPAPSMQTTASQCKRVSLLHETRRPTGRRRRIFPRKAPSPTRLSYPTLNRTACFQSNPPGVSAFPFPTGAITAPSRTRRRPPSVPGPHPNRPAARFPLTKGAASRSRSCSRLHTYSATHLQKYAIIRLYSFPVRHPSVITVPPNEHTSWGPNSRKRPAATVEELEDEDSQWYQSFPEDRCAGAIFEKYQTHFQTMRKEQAKQGHAP
ncbi:hypothetical protein C8J57DRAFT_1537318 [Mycena rebaudengoi]|nr:hypothetical protein C8J57DRAFT_1537318 [Mycena rebaudengoi]